jgi:hypothetical protein
MKESALFARSKSNGKAGAIRKKSAAAIHQEVAREIDQLLCRIFTQRRTSGSTELEAIESALRSSLHQAGAKALNALLQFDAPAPDRRQLPCACGHQAQYQQLRSRPVLTVVGWTRIYRRDRNSRGVWQTNLPGSLEPRLEPCRKEGGHPTRRNHGFHQVHVSRHIPRRPPEMKRG